MDNMENKEKRMVTSPTKDGIPLAPQHIQRQENGILGIQDQGMVSERRHSNHEDQKVLRMLGENYLRCWPTAYPLMDSLKILCLPCWILETVVLAGTNPVVVWWCSITWLWSYSNPLPLISLEDLDHRSHPPPCMPLQNRRTPEFLIQWPTSTVFRCFPGQRCMYLSRHCTMVPLVSP